MITAPSADQKHDSRVMDSDGAGNPMKKRFRSWQPSSMTRERTEPPVRRRRYPRLVVRDRTGHFIANPIDSAPKAEIPTKPHIAQGRAPQLVVEKTPLQGDRSSDITAQATNARLSPWLKPNETNLNIPQGDTKRKGTGASAATGPAANVESCDKRNAGEQTLRVLKKRRLHDTQKENEAHSRRNIVENAPAPLQVCTEPQLKTATTKQASNPSMPSAAKIVLRKEPEPPAPQVEYEANTRQADGAALDHSIPMEDSAKYVESAVRQTEAAPKQVSQGCVQCIQEREMVQRRTMLTDGNSPYTGANAVGVQPPYMNHNGRRSQEIGQSRPPVAARPIRPAVASPDALQPSQKRNGDTPRVNPPNNGAVARSIVPRGNMPLPQETVILAGTRCGTQEYWRSSLQMPRKTGVVRAVDRASTIPTRVKRGALMAKESCPPLPRKADGAEEAREFWRSATKLPSMKGESFRIRKLAEGKRRIDGSAIVLDTSVPSANGCGTEKDQGEGQIVSGGVEPDSGGGNGACDGQQSGGAAVERDTNEAAVAKEGAAPQRTTEELIAEMHLRSPGDLRRLVYIKHFELKRLKRLAQVKFAMKVNLRGRMKLEKWLQLYQTNYLPLKFMAHLFNLDRRLLSDDKYDRRFALVAMTNEELRILEALMLRLKTGSGQSNWKLLTTHMTVEVFVQNLPLGDASEMFNDSE